MPIYLNGGSNPAAVRFNSANLSAVYFAPDENADFTQVWGADDYFPDTLGLVTVTQSDGCKAYFRNPVLDTSRTFVDPTTGKYWMRYNCDVTLESSFPKGVLVGVTNTYNQEVLYVTNAGSPITAASGIPTGYSFRYGSSPSYSYQTLAFDVYQEESTVIHEDTKVAMNLPTSMSVRKEYTVLDIRGPGNNWPIYTRSTGWIYQGTGVLALTKDL